uniref:O-methyltransferase n=1 Tax=Steinernema glaseri TaxID=37863 RepID=A0A1I8A5K3_9BILA
MFLKETRTALHASQSLWKKSATPEVVQLFVNLLHLQRPTRSLVAGVFTGLSLLGTAAITDTRGIVIGLEYPQYAHHWESVGMKHALKAGIMNRIQVRSVEAVNRAMQKLAVSEPNAFDFIFLNDAKQQNYIDDYEHSVRLLRSGGLLLISDALAEGSVLSGPDYVTPETRIVQSMNIKIKSDSRVAASLLPFSGGTWLVVKK